MSNPEDVDEINEYLQARRKKQDLGELPKPDATPGFIKKLGTAIFGPPKITKVPLNSTQPTYASPQAQNAVRKQLAEIMQEKGRTTNTTRAIIPPSTTAPPARSLSSIPSPSVIASSPVSRYPTSEVWQNVATKPTLPTPPVSTIPSKPNTPNPAAPIKVSAYIPTSVPRTPPISTVPAVRETPRYMPPWVARDQKTNPLAPRVNPPISSRANENNTENNSPITLSSARMPYSAASTPTQPLKETILPTISREDAPTPEAERMNEMRRNSFQSGEVKIESVTPAPIATPIVMPVVEPIPPVSPVHEHEREMTEQEALEKLPFEDVDGLSEDDLAYLERKEKEHRAAQEQREDDHVSPDALRAQLDRQAQHVEATAPPATPTQQTDEISGSDEKKKILERLRQMMATEAHPPEN